MRSFERKPQAVSPEGEEETLTYGIGDTGGLGSGVRWGTIWKAIKRQIFEWKVRN